MALPACLRLADDVFPRVRQHASSLLVAGGWSQGRAAKALGVSQAMVSKYLGREPVTDVLALRLAEELYLDLTEGPRAPAVGPSTWCHTLSVGDDAAARDALQDLLEGERSLLSRPPLDIMPQIGLNLVRALPDATDETRVLGYPGRIIAAADRLLVPAPPSPGGSGHLARCLLHLRTLSPGAAALASAAGTPEVVRRAEHLGLKVAGPPLRLPKDPDQRFAAIVAAGHHADAYLDPGAVGLEPCLYVPGQDARFVVAVLHRLHEARP